MIQLLFVIIPLLTPAKSPISNKIADKTDISGHWEGTITRDEGAGKRTTFKMELDLQQKGKDITGISYVHAEQDKRVFSANMSVVGKFSRSYFKYEEMKMLNFDPIPNGEWCIKKAELIFRTEKNSTPTLEGIWEGKTGTNAECMPGRISLHKKPPRV